MSQPCGQEDPRSQGEVKSHKVVHVPFLSSGFIGCLVILFLGVTGYRRFRESTKPPESPTLAVLRGPAESICSLAFSPQGHILATIGFDQAVDLWDLSGREHFARFQTSQHSPGCVAFNPKGDTFVIGNYDGTVTLWELDSGKGKTVLECSSSVRAVTFAPDGKTIAAGCSDGTTVLLDVESCLKRAQFASHAGSVYSLAFSPNSDGHAPNNVAKRSLIPDSVISRSRLRPQYGQGWRPTLDSGSRRVHTRDLGKEESS